MNKNQFLLGITLIVVAVIILLSNINIGFARELISSWWPLLIVALGLNMLWNDRNNIAWGMIITGVGIGLLVNTLGVFGLTFGDVFVPIVLIAIGAAVITGALGGSEPKSRLNTSSEEKISAILGGANSRNSSEDYKGGSLNAIMGGVELDLTKAVINKEAVLQVWVLMGGITIRVPEGLVIKQRTVNILGAIEDKTLSTNNKNAPVVYIDGTITMGAVEIKY